MNIMCPPHTLQISPSRLGGPEFSKTQKPKVPYLGVLDNP
jgi:hypothetical protein